MARKVILIDDLDGEQEADETVLFGVDGVDYQVDLCTENAQKLRGLLEPFVSVARPAGRGSDRAPMDARTAQAAAHKKRKKLDAIRSWAKEEGLEISDRGRIPVVIQEAYDEAHPA